MQLLEEKIILIDLSMVKKMEELYYSFSLFTPDMWLINADVLSFIRENFSILRNSKLIGDNITFLASSGGLLVQPFRQQKFLVYRQRAALIAADQLALLGLARVLDIAGVVVQTRPDGFSFILPHGNQPCCRQCHHPPAKKKMPHIGGIKVIWIIFRNQKHQPDTRLPAEHSLIRY